MNFDNWLKDIVTQKMNRRNFIETAGKSVATTAIGFSIPSVLKTEDVEAAQSFTDYPFTLGVASGDPLPDSIVLWTRLAPNPMAPDGRGGMENIYLQVQWEVSEDEDFRKIIRSGTEVAAPDLAHSVHAEVYGLRPGKEYYYRFKAGNETSPVGRTKTAPEHESHLKNLSFAIASCQSWTGGRFAAYHNMAKEELDFVLHLGDYIYEKGNTETLADYRLLHAQYKTSPDLQAAHLRFPFILTFDDHEVDNDWSNDISDPNYPEGNRDRFLAVRAAAFQAYYEHMPLRRRSKPNGPDMLLYRKFIFGDLAEFSVMDTRQYRNNQVGKGFPGGPLDPEAANPDRTIMGSEQGEWLMKNLNHSRAKWNVIAQQTMMAQYDYDPGEGISVNHDQWDGYSADRDRLFTFIKENQPSNPIVLSGDWHSSWVNDLKSDFNDPKSETLATEFVGTSISSGCGWKDAVEKALLVNPHVKFFNGDYRGYVRCNVTHNSWENDYRVVSSASNPDVGAGTLASFVVKDGTPGALRIGGVNVSNISASTLVGGRLNPITLFLSNGMTKPVRVTVTIDVPKGWKSNSVTKILAPSSTSMIEVLVTPPALTPAAEKLKVKVDAGNSNVYSVSQELQVVSVPSRDTLLFALDSGSTTSAIYPGYTRLSPEDVWDVAKGYGWVGTVPSSRDRNKLDTLQRDFTLSNKGKTILRLAVPAGTVQAYLLTGDAIYGAGKTIIQSEGKFLADSGNEALNVGQFKWIQFQLDGGPEGREIDLEFSGALNDGYWRLGALILMKQPS